MRSTEDKDKDKEKIEHLYYLAGDPAKAHDYFGIVLLERIDKTIRLLAVKELQLDYTIVANYIQSLHKRYRLQVIFLDKTGVGNVFIDMLKAKGLNVEGITLSNPKKVEIIETVIRLMQERRIILPKKGAEELKKQLQEQERDLTQSGMVRFKHPGNAHDDLFWAFCIGAYGMKPYLESSGTIMVAHKKLTHTVDIYSDDYLGTGVPDRLGVSRIDRAVHLPG